MRLLMTVVLLGCCSSALRAEADLAPKAEVAEIKNDPSRGISFYNLFDLVGKADLIMVAEIGATADGVTSLAVHQSLKTPRKDARNVDPEVLKRAADLLADDKLDLPPLAAKAPGAVKVTVERGMKLPPQGTQALFFLWEKGEGGLGYRVGHPQCIYDAELLPQVKGAIDQPRSAADGRFLRDWDRQMAERTRQRAADQAFLRAKSGNVEMGMQIKATRPALALRGDNSFSVSAVLENTFPREQSVYDGPAGGYGVRLRPKGAEPEAGMILRVTLTNVVAGMDNSVLDITDATDFTSLSGNSTMSKELYLDAKLFPVLKTLNGEYILSVFFTTQQDGKGVLEKTAWTGTLISEEIPLKFEQRASR
jgi:hypothetical protein